MKYQAVIFDLDGTLADTSLGILDCHRYAHRMMGRNVPDEQVLRRVIGGPLLRTYQEMFGFSEADARRAVTYYRQHYEEQGIHGSALYPGMDTTLRELAAAGLRLGVATLKAQRFLNDLLGSLGITDYFSAVYGMDNADSQTKAQLIGLCLRKLHAAPEDAVMIGDSIHDRNGARGAGVPFIGVTYGFGFTKNTSAAQAGAAAMADSCAQLSALLL